MATEKVRGEVIEKVVKIKRRAAVVKGGRRFSFAAMVVIGNGQGRVGWGYGKANEVPPSVEKAVKEGMRSQVDVPLEGSSIPHTVHGRKRQFVQCGMGDLETVQTADAPVARRLANRVIDFQGNLKMLDRLGIGGLGVAAGGQRIQRVGLQVSLPPFASR